MSRRLIEILCLLAGGFLLSSAPLVAGDSPLVLSHDVADSLRSDTTGRSELPFTWSGEALFSLVGFAGGANADYLLFRTGERAGIMGAVRGFLCYQYLAHILVAGGSESVAAGINLQVGGYFGNFAGTLGVGFGIIGGELTRDIAGGVTDVSAEFLLGSGPGLGAVLTGRLFVKDWSRYLLLTSNASGYGGIGVRYTL